MGQTVSEQFNVLPGPWKEPRVIGPHRVNCGDILDPGTMVRLMGQEKADLIYSDPPWGEGNVRFWRTFNGQKDESRSFTWADFIKAFVETVVTYAGGPVFLEMGNKWADEVSAMFAAQGFTEIQRWGITYGPQKWPSTLLLYAPPGVRVPTVPGPGPTGMNGTKRSRVALEPFAAPGLTIFDPCCGMGDTARVAVKTGMHFRGNELNHFRLAETVKVLSRGR